MKFACAIAAASICSAAFAETGFLDRSLIFQGETYHYQVYVPDSYNPSSNNWPVIMFLHGVGGLGADGLKPTGRFSLADLIRKDRSRVPAIVVFPQAKVGARWTFANMQELAIAEVERTIAEFHGDSHRVYLTGFSMGASGAYRIAYRWPEKFASIAVVAGSIESPSFYSPEERKIDRSSNEYLIAADTFAAFALRFKGVPIWIFFGDQDDGTPVEQTRKLVATLKSAGAAVQYTEYAATTHLDSADKAYADSNMIDWLLKQRR
jgi:predicted peptidase